MLSGSCLVEENFCKTVTPHISRIFFNPLAPNFSLQLQPFHEYHNS